MGQISKLFLANLDTTLALWYGVRDFGPAEGLQWAWAKAW